MTMTFRKLSYAVPGAADLGAIVPTDAEMAIHNDDRLRAWVRASVNYEQNRVVDRSRQVSFDKIPRSPMPAKRVNSGLYNGKPYLEILDQNPNYSELRSSAGILPSTTSYSLAFVAHWKNTGAARYAFFGNDAASSALFWSLGINVSSGRIELKNSNNTFATTGSGAFTPAADTPFLAIVGIDQVAGTMSVKANRAAAKVSPAGAVTGNIGAATKLQVGSSGGDSFGRASPLIGGGVAEFMLFDTDITADTALIARIEATLGDRYGFAA